MLKFGTDGVRGVANLDLTPELVLALGRAAARVLGSDSVVIGRDTRRSGPLIEAALCAGLASEGVDVVRLGVAPTPAVAWVAAERRVAAAVVSASHNPFDDNGVKLFATGGRKLDDAGESDLEAELHRLLSHEVAATPPTGDEVGDVSADAGALDGWLASLAGSIEGRQLDGVHVVADCANGAASAFAAPLLRSLGATVDVLHARPDGVNINAGSGSTHPDRLQAEVAELGAAVGLAFDGDADRCLAVDAGGRIIDGDQLLAALAIDRHARGTLAGDAVVVTVMTNLGFRRGMARRGIDVIETPVGDRHVLAALDERGLSLGGEQSGHLIFRDLAGTGDGLLTAVQVLDLVERSRQPLAALVDDAMTRLPQVLHNVRLARRGSDVAAELAGDIAAAEAQLGEHGRVLVRSSGTEPVVRVMVEAESEAVATEVAARLVARVERL